MNKDKEDLIRQAVKIMRLIDQKDKTLKKWKFYKGIFRKNIDRINRRTKALRQNPNFKNKNATLSSRSKLLIRMAYHNNEMEKFIRDMEVHLFNLKKKKIFMMKQ